MVNRNSEIVFILCNLMSIYQNILSDELKIVGTSDSLERIQYWKIVRKRRLLEEISINDEINGERSLILFSSEIMLTPDIWETFLMPLSCSKKVKRSTKLV